MFELEHEIDEWKNRFAQLDSVRGPDVEELEVHLRDSIVELASKGLTEEEAFCVAARRLGAATAVGREFEKINPGYAWTRRVFPWFASAAALVLVNIVGFCAIAWMLESQIDSLERTVGPLRAALDKQVVFEQHAFPPGKCHYYLSLHQIDSFGELVDQFESSYLNHYVSDGSYGKEWILVDHHGLVIPQKSKLASLDDAGISPGAVLRVASVKEGRLSLGGKSATIVSDPL